MKIVETRRRRKAHEERVRRAKRRALCDSGAEGYLDLSGVWHNVRMEWPDGVPLIVHGIGEYTDRVLFDIETHK